MVAAASDHVTGGATGQLVQIGLGDLIQAEVQLAGQLGDIPKDIPELQLQALAHLSGEFAAGIPEHLFDLVRHFAGLTTEPQGRVDRVLADIGIARCLPGALLIGVEIHWYNSAGGPR